MPSSPKPAETSSFQPDDGPSAKFNAEKAHWTGLASRHLLEHGYQGQSFRHMATSLGTSHRMLTHYFGSARHFWEVVLTELRRSAQSELFARPKSTSNLPGLEQVWHHFTQDKYLSIFRLTFHLYEEALNDPANHAAFLKEVVEDWVGPVSANLQQAGLSRDDAVAEARLRLAVIRGLALDLLTTGDREGTTRALKRFAQTMAPP